jgi:formamidopyrimidine-DNA glycosylase
MPELPEVETVRNVLKTWLIGRTIKKCYILYPKIVENNVSNEEFIKTVENQKIIDVLRKGKFLIIVLENNVLISHLRMEGKYHLGFYKERLDDDNPHDYYWMEGNHDIQNKHVHFILLLDDMRLLMYDDVRKFGRIMLSTLDECYTIPPLSNLGIDANLDNIDPNYLFEKLRKLKVTIKQALLNQQIISGLGNIYVDEVLFLSKILPSRSASQVSLEECDLILKNSKIVLDKAIRLGGSTIRTYHAANGVDGKFQNELYVYGRDNEKCLVCGTVIQKTKVGGRGTHYCPSCQK